MAPSRDEAALGVARSRDTVASGGMLRRLLWLLLGAVAGFFLARRRAGSVEEAPLAEDPALELRRKLEEAKAREGPVVEAGDVEDFASMFSGRFFGPWPSSCS